MNSTTPNAHSLPRARASINDVAIHAGVSAQTVSRVANSQTNVRPATRDRVLASMQALGYRPNSAARNLKSGRFRSIGVVTFNLRTLGNERTLDAIAFAAAAAGYTTTLLPVADPTQVDVAGAFGRLEEQAVDGIILIMSAEVGSPDELTLTAGLPLVIVDSDAALPHTIVDTDQEQGARLAVEHLLALGHRDIVHVSGPATSFSAKRRAEAYRAVMSEAGLPVPPIIVGDWSAASGLAAGRAIAASERMPTAVFASNDQMALGVMSAFHELGLSVPGDVSVVGFDDADDAEAYWPPLTSVHQNFDEVGKSATRLLIATIDGEAETTKLLIPTQLVVRASTSAPRGR
ncbi:LacI family transcriptional regulator [Leifsonia sp. Root4]|uniref:LacI family DNA-binding transcriptional regulator n=1 Tax=Leifsonia sp. Root4 TaxID=1736525 RepID=UPI0006F60567|nr:LacI family DNA-binding transcriptional regulator [Leifsonia sp. Root4]KQW06305.1 LacI family transcriptional regulator [Leifsonia sp. Root4]